jgi:hypothetical protein
MVEREDVELAVVAESHLTLPFIFALIVEGAV